MLSSPQMSYSPASCDDSENEFINSFCVSVPPGSVGVAFETAFNPDRIVVLKVKPKSFAAESTSIAVGDALLAINGISTKGMLFDEVMQLLIGYQGKEGCILTLLSAEEQARQVRLGVISRLREQETQKGCADAAVEMSRV
mmetsp:Transcript_22550/g.42046  ORF Transcript_22550/g.42046 Transcript_22550/m.42046 type:complete len:141 (-) Transcript_22550:2575-2997(-)